MNSWTINIEFEADDDWKPLSAGCWIDCPLRSLIHTGDQCRAVNMHEQHPDDPILCPIHKYGECTHKNNVVGILESTSANNILTLNGFEPEATSITGHLHNCYTKYIQLASPYCAYVSVDLNGGVEIYVEYDCGGEVATYYWQLNTEWNVNPKKFFNELDQIVTEFLNR